MRFVFWTLLWFAGGYSALGLENKLPGGSFETPVVTARTEAAKGGDPSEHGKGPGWLFFQFAPGAKITGGLTNEVARTGKQSLFIRFDHVTAASQATLISKYVPVVSGSEYEVGIWGRTDASDPMTVGGRSVYLKLDLDFFTSDENTSVGEPVYAVQPLPGSKQHHAYFLADRWAPFFVRTRAPEGAAFAQITWSWQTGSDPGEVNGVMFFDDAMVVGP